jgi:hypothetical protein
MTTTTSGIHTMSGEEYHADLTGGQPTLNASVAKLLINASPLHAWTAHCRLNPDYRETVDKKFDVGTAAHEVFLLGNDDRVHVLDPAFKDWRKKEVQEERDQARAEGLVPLLAHEWVNVSAMLTALREQLPRIDASPPLFRDGDAEQTLLWTERGVACRARLDWLHKDFSAVDDLKTAGRSANPFVWTRSTMWSMGADIQTAFNLRGVKAVSSVDAGFRFVVIETSPPYALSVISLAPDALALANAKIDRALEIWKRCLETDEWPAYPRQVCYAEAPPWAEAEFLTQQAVDEELAAA